jgi:hypothetical protein
MLSVKVAAGVALLGAAVVLAALVAVPSTNSVAMGSALMGTWTKQHGIGIDKEPYSAPMNLWLYWGSMTNRRFTASGEHVRHVFKMGNIAGGEWRDPKFLRSLEGGLFNKLSSLCCTALLFPPLEWDFLVVNPQKIVGQNIRAYVANGNTMIFTGGIISLEFINRYFSYQLEPADGNLDPGPFLRLPKFQGFTQEQHKIMTEGTPSTERAIPVLAVSQPLARLARLLPPRPRRFARCATIFRARARLEGQWRVAAVCGAVLVVLVQLRCAR